MRGVIRTTGHLVTPPMQPAVTVDYARRHIRALTNAQDVLIAMWIEAGGAYFEEQTGRQLITATRELWLDAFPGQYLGFVPAYGQPDPRLRIEIPNPPLQRVLGVTYVDASGATQTLDDGGSPALPLYTTQAPQGPYAPKGWIEPLFGMVWPTARAQGAAVKIQYQCGYGDAPSDIPALALGIVCYMVAHFDQFRSAVHEVKRGQMLELPYGVEMMMSGFKYSALSRDELRDGIPWHTYGMTGPW